MELTQKTIDTISRRMGGIVFKSLGTYIENEDSLKLTDKKLFEAFKEIDNETVTWSEMAYVLSMLSSDRYVEDEEKQKVNIKFTEGWNA